VQKDEALTRAIRDLSRELQELVEDGVRLGWTVTFNMSSGIMTLRSPGIHGTPEVIGIPRGERSLNEGKSRAWHSKLRRYADPARLTTQDKELLGQLPPKLPAKSSPPRPGDLPPARPVEEVELPKVSAPPDLEVIHEAAERARKAQEAVNELGAGPPTPGVPKKYAPRQGGISGRKGRRRPCLICGELKMNMGPHYAWHRRRGEILVVKREGKEVEVTSTPEQQAANERYTKLADPDDVAASDKPLDPLVQHMELQEAVQLIYEAASDALGLDTKRLQQQVDELHRRNDALTEDNRELREKLANIQKMFQ